VWRTDSGGWWTRLKGQGSNAVSEEMHRTHRCHNSVRSEDRQRHLRIRSIAFDLLVITLRGGRADATIWACRNAEAHLVGSRCHECIELVLLRQQRPYGLWQDVERRDTCFSGS